MTLEATFQNDDARAEHIVSLLGDAPDPAPAGQGDGAAATAQPEIPASAPQAQETAPETPASGDKPVDAAAVEPDPVPAIEPPASLNAEIKARWKDLPADLQRTFAQWESERNSGVNQKLSEAAEARKAAERLQSEAQAKVEAAATERQRYLDQLNTVIGQVEAIDPIIAEGRKADRDGSWVRWAQEDPAGTQTKWHQYQQRQQQLGQMMQERNRLAQQQMAEHFAREDAALVEKVPDWKDPSKGPAELRALKDTVRERYGFGPAELSTIADHRFVLIARDAVNLAAENADIKAQLAAKEKAHADALKAIEEKRVQPAPSKVLQPGNGNDGADNDERTKAILKQAKGLRRDDERAALIARIL
jgi:hypothetical protein